MGSVAENKYIRRLSKKINWNNLSSCFKVMHQSYIFDIYIYISMGMYECAYMDRYLSSNYFICDDSIFCVFIFPTNHESY